MRQQRGARYPALNRQPGHRRLRDGLAVAAAHLGTRMHHHFEMRRNIFQDFTFVRSDARHIASAACGTHAIRLVLHPLARQMLRQGPAHGLTFLLAGRG